MIFKTTRFGDIDVSEDEIITFPNSLLGFDGCYRFTLLPNPGGGPVQWMQSLEQDNLAFILCDPQSVVADYQLNVKIEELNIIQVQDLSEAVVKVIMRVPPEPHRPTVNLMGPLFINFSKQLGMQYVVNNSKWSCRYEVGS